MRTKYEISFDPLILVVGFRLKRYPLVEIGQREAKADFTERNRRFKPGMDFPRKRVAIASLYDDVRFRLFGQDVGLQRFNLLVNVQLFDLIGSACRL